MTTILCNLFGVYANLTAGPIVLKGDYCLSTLTGKAAGYYTFDLDPLTLGLGGGVYF